jgi:CheY-like chemotaxis protein
MHRILIADDDARMRQMVKEIVAGFASAVYEAGDGAEAVAVCAAQRPDWVLMDLRMKPMDGLRATAEIRARFPGTHVVIVSQYDEAEPRAEAARVGACAYVLKENLHELPGILARAVPEGPAAGANAAREAPPNAIHPAAPKESGSVQLTKQEPNKSI